jgi:hypothetical protein
MNVNASEFVPVVSNSQGSHQLRSQGKGRRQPDRAGDSHEKSKTKPRQSVADVNVPNDNGRTGKGHRSSGSRHRKGERTLAKADSKAEVDAGAPAISTAEMDCQNTPTKESGLADMDVAAPPKFAGGLMLHELNNVSSALFNACFLVL